MHIQSIIYVSHYLMLASASRKLIIMEPGIRILVKNNSMYIQTCHVIHNMNNGARS